MSLTYSSMLDLDSTLIEFDLYNAITNINFTSNALDKTKPSLIMFICNHCPYVIHYHEQIQKLEYDFKEVIDMVAISSNDVINYPQDGPEEMKLLWEKLGLSFPYLFDESQSIAKKYRAACTPEFYLFAANKKLVYRGRFDDTNPSSNREPDGKDLRTAINCIIKANQCSLEQYPSMGCNINWKYFSNKLSQKVDRL